jgi:hypothetical protein
MDIVSQPAAEIGVRKGGVAGMKLQSENPARISTQLCKTL